MEDCVEFRSETEEGDEFWERGIIKGIIGANWHWNTTKDEWLYYYEITEASYGIDYQGKTGTGLEDELTLIRWPNRMLQPRP